MNTLGPDTSGDIPITYEFGWQALRHRLDMDDEQALLALGDHAGGLDGRAGRVSALLGLAFEQGDRAFDPDRLSLVDRTAALFSLAFRFGTWPARFVCLCAECGAGNELRVAPDEFAYTDAEAYQVGAGDVHLMQPNGHHERLIEAGRPLTAGDLSISGSPNDDENALNALAAKAPDFTAALPYGCASCEAENRFWFDPLVWIADHLRGLLREVHQLARAYGWTEDQILALPRSRRRAYIRLIAEGQGA